jgi:SpoVK/Ycf46/Vps4 family AAA+-type ATPase
LLVTDMSRLLSKWVGESQQNVSAVFDEFEEKAARAKVRPVLLLDECDQFLLKRTGMADSGSDRMHHEMQNLFLDRLERFQGIVVATTNLVEAIDPAFSRRFDYKLVFPQPGESEREKIWRTHLPAGVPLLEEMDFQALAADFAFSGGQIALVMRNAIHEAATRGDGLAMRDLYAAAEVELHGAFLKPNGRPLGFLRSDAA